MTAPSLRIYPAFDTRLLPGGVMTFRFDEGAGDLTATIVPGLYSHVTMASVVSTVTLFATAIKNAMEVPSALTYTVTYVESVRGYTIHPSAGNVSLHLDAGTPAEINAAAALGFDQIEVPSASTLSSDRTTYYSLAGTVGGRGATTPEYEPDDVGDVGETDDGGSSMESRTTAPLYYDFTVPFETEATVHNVSAVTADPWTWQRFFPHVRSGDFPFLVKDSASAQNSVHKLRKDGMSFRPQNVAADESFQSYWNIALKTYLLGRV